ncbi:hypothetical protein HDU93_007345 [Gonapodya sp. JEL0774]|nr:hypothetical protein HDU93_007345 [Gonapodya sp. JEL0774]
MASSLAKQLRAIGNASNTSHTGSAGTIGTGRASLLFEPEKAADMDIDQVYVVGIAGLHELSSKYDPQDLVLPHHSNPRFSAFESTLFSPTVKGVDRTQQTKADNAKLDSSIGIFLRILSPYCLDRSAWKALEWLIRKFRINEFNLEAILECILPFHETEFFVKMVTILKVPSNTLTALLPHVFTFAKAKTAPDLQSGAYLVFSTISTRVSLSTEAVEAFLIAASKHRSQGTAEGQALLAMVHVCQSQEELKEFPDDAFKSLVWFESLVDRISAIIGSYNAIRFLELVVTKLYNSCVTDGRLTSILISLLQLSHFPLSVVKSLSRAIMDTCFAGSDLTGSGEFLEPTPTLLRLFSTRYPLVLQETLQAALAGAALDGSERQLRLSRIDALLKGTLGGSRYSPTVVSTENGTSETTPLFLGLRHSDPNVRMMSFRKLESMLRAGEVTEPGFAAAVLLEGLSDPEPTVVEVVLRMNDLSIWIDDKKGLGDVLLSIVETQAGQSTSSAVSEAALTTMVRFIAADGGAHSNSHYLAILQRLFVVGKSSRKTALKLGKMLSQYNSVSGLFWKLLKGVPRIVDALRLKGDHGAQNGDSTDYKKGGSDKVKAVKDYNNALMDILTENLAGLIGTSDFDEAKIIYLECMQHPRSAVLRSIGSVIVAKCVISLCARSKEHGFEFIASTLPPMLRRLKETNASQNTSSAAATDVVSFGDAFGSWESWDEATIHMLSAVTAIRQLGQLTSVGNSQIDNKVVLATFKTLMTFDYLKPVEYLLKVLFQEGIGAASVARFVVFVSMGAGEFFIDIDKEGQTILFETLLKIVTWSGKSNIIALAKQVVERLPVSPDAIATEFECCLSVLPSLELQVAKKRKSAMDTARSPEQLVTALEYANYMRIPQERKPIFAALFGILAALTVSKSQQFSISIEYCRQLCLSAIYRLTDSLLPGRADDEVSPVFVMAAVTDNPQTHSVALLLVARLAQLNPQRIFNIVMPAFTYFGTNLVRQDDDYSFYVIHKTIETVLPGLGDGQEEQGSNSDEIIFKLKPILKVFIDNLVFVPKHRRLRLFVLLISSLGAPKFLEPTLTLLLERYTLMWNANAKEKALVRNSSQEDLLEFGLSLVAEFDIRIQLRPKSEEEMEALPALLFDTRTHDDKDYREFRNLVTNFVSKLISDKSFVSQLAAANKPSKGSQPELDPDIMKLIEVLLKITANVERHVSSFRDRDGGALAGFWKGISKASIGLLDKAHRLLSPTSFLKVVSSLVRHENSAIRRKAMSLVGEQLAADELRFSNASTKVLREVLEEVLKTIQVEGVSDDDAVVNKQVALICFTKMAQKMAKRDPDTFLAAIPSIIGPGALSWPNEQVSASAMVAVAAVTQEIGARILPFLSKYLPVIMTALQNMLDAESTSSAASVAQLSALGSLIVTVNAVPRFVSPYLQDLVQCSLHKSVVGNKAHAQVRSKAIELRKAVAKEVLSRVVIPVLCGQWKYVVGNGTEACVALFDFVESAIATIPNDELDGFIRPLFKYFLVAFDTRNSFKDWSEIEIDRVEGRSLSAFVAFSLRLNESQFRPLYLKIVQWATDNQPNTGNRQLFFFRMVNELLANLQGIFVPFFGYALEPALATLESYKSSKRMPDTLWTYVVGSMEKTFLYDSNEVFDRVMQPLVDQLDFTSDSGDTEDAYTARVATHLIPAIAQLSVVASGELFWKALNNSVLLKTRSTYPSVRIAAVRTVQQFYARHGEEFLDLLGETVPFLAELLEDEDDSVEKVCREVCKSIEDILGEDLTEYMNK